MYAKLLSAIVYCCLGTYQKYSSIVEHHLAILLKVYVLVTYRIWDEGVLDRRRRGIERERASIGEYTPLWTITRRPGTVFHTTADSNESRGSGAKIGGYTSPVDTTGVYPAGKRDWFT